MNYYGRRVQQMRTFHFTSVLYLSIFLAASDLRDVLHSDVKVYLEFNYVRFSNSLLASFYLRPLPQGGPKTVHFGPFSVGLCNIQGCITSSYIYNFPYRLFVRINPLPLSLIHI